MDKFPDGFPLRNGDVIKLGDCKFFVFCTSLICFCSFEPCLHILCCFSNCGHLFFYYKVKPISNLSTKTKRRFAKCVRPMSGQSQTRYNAINLTVNVNGSG